MDWDNTLIVEVSLPRLDSPMERWGDVVWKYFDWDRRDFGEDDSSDLRLFHQSTVDETIAMGFRVDRIGSDSRILCK